MAEAMEIKVAPGVIECHFDENVSIARQNVLNGRPVFEGFRPPTLIRDPRYPDGYMVLRFNG